MSTTTIGSLFAGIGGLELGLERAGLGPVEWQVEIDPALRAVLGQHWPKVKRYGDIRAVGAHNLAPVDIICGGFPCQDISSAGKRAGLRGPSSGLWHEFRRVVREVRPAWVVVENVSSGARSWVNAVTQGLEQLGYAVLPVPLTAEDVGAPHRRARIFLVATHADGESEPARTQHAEVAASSHAADAHGGKLRHQPGRSGGTHRSRASIARVDGVERHAPAHALRARRQGHRSKPRAVRLGPVPQGWRPPVPSVLRVAHGLSSRLDAARPRIRALGNSVVPQCAEVIGHIIVQLNARGRP